MAGDIIEPVHLPSSITQSWRSPVNADNFSENDIPENMDSRLQEMEIQMIVKALNRSRGIQKQAAKILGIKERSLWHRLKKYDIDASSFKIR